MKTPWHIWAVGIGSLLWSAGSAFDYVMTQTKNDAYMAQFTPEMLAYYYGFPTWSIAAWAIGVWGAIAGAILLLLRKSWAVAAYAASLAALVVNLIYMFGLSDGLAIMGTGGAAFMVVIFVMAVLLLFYARRQKSSGVLS